jgi:eukaryotic-like serine/threonine-protein kinase
MATSTESNPPAKDASTPPAKPAAAASDVRGLSGVSELNLEKSIIRRGLATPHEVEACKAHRAKLAAKDASKSLIDIMVDAKVLTKSQSIRLLKEVGNETGKKFEIPGYEIIEKLGKGSMGLVFKARQTSVERIVAVKVLLDTLAQNKEFIKRFQREAKIAAKLQHNNIVNAIDAGEVEGHHYFVMEYVEGATIKDELDKNKVFDEKVALKIVLAVADAMKHAHERGLIHRDIKPENVILTKDGQVKLADLGLARLTADEKWAMSEAGMAIGTPYYISPEQVRGQVDVDIRGDIYSLGATLYHMVTGRVPYPGETPQEVMRKHVDKNALLIPPDHINTKLSSGLGVVVETMMSKNRDQRYRSPDDLILDLKCLQQGESPMIAGQKTDALAGLAEGDVSEDGVAASPVSELERVEMAGYINSRNTIIAALAAFLGLSILTNIVVLLTR